ncbi:LOW QUALITY PROTEIN: angiogenic factor with G patch and FHA domains 1 [Pterocles gutturalis]
MASPPAAGDEQRALRERVAELEADLGACRGQLERVQRRLRRTELYREAREGGGLRRRVEELTDEIKKRKEKDTSREVQTEDYAAWSQADYYYYEKYYNHTDTQDCASELPVQHHETEDTEHNFTEESQSASIPLSNEAAEGGEEEDLIQNSQEAEDTSVPEVLAESLRAAAEAAVSQTGFIYDENTGLYYDHSHGFYYNSENQLYYDPATGIYYYWCGNCSYQFILEWNLQSYQTSGTQHTTRINKGNNEEKIPERTTANEYKDLDTEEHKSSNSLNCFSTTEQVSSTEEEESPNIRKKTKMDMKPGNSLTAKDSVSTDSINSHSRKSTPDTAAYTDDSKTADTESEPEEGEITDSECEAYSSEVEVTSEETADSEDSENEDEEKIWPPCIRVIVIRSPVLQTGSLYIITAVKPATIGREKDVGHTLQILKWSSKFHAEVYFDHNLQNYVLVDQGSQNGTVVNGNQILQPKTKCDPYILEHGDEVKIGETVLSFHIHPGSDTCDGCEPGQVRAHLRLDRKKESSGSCYRGIFFFIMALYFINIVITSVSLFSCQLGIIIQYMMMHFLLGMCVHVITLEQKLSQLSYVSKHCYFINKFNLVVFFLVCPALSKEERELVQKKSIKQIGFKYGLQNTEYEDNKAVEKSQVHKIEQGKRRETIGSEGTFQRDDSPASVHIEISNSNKGHKMLEKMGWKKGEGLGKDGSGMKDPIHLQLHKTHAGLGTSRPASIEDVQIIQSKKKNWDKARERFAENFQEPKSQRDTPKITPWVRGTVE